MELFKLLGTIAIDNSEANRSLSETSRQAAGTSESVSKSNEQIKRSNNSSGSSWSNLKSKVSEYKTQGMSTSAAWRKATSEMRSGTEDAGNGIVGTLKRIGGAVVTFLAVDKIKDFGLSCINAAADASAMESQFSQVFGDLESKASKSLSSIADNAGMNENRMKSSFTQIAAFAKTSGMDTKDALSLSERAMVAVADSAAFYDRSLEDTTESLQSFLKGNYENDAALGLSATETTRNAAANKLYGKSFNDLSESQKQLTLLQMVEDANKASGALGQAARESDTWTNMTGNLKQAWTDFLAVIGSNVLPAAVGVVKSMVGMIESWTEKVPALVNWCKEHETIIQMIGIALGTVAVAIGAYNLSLHASAIAAGIATAATSAFGAVMAFITSPITLVVLAIGALVAAGVLLYKNWDTVREKALDLFEKMKEVWANIKTSISEKVEEIKTGLIEKWQSIKTTVSEAVDNIKTAISEKFTAVKESVVNTFNNVRISISTAWETIKNVVKVGIMFIVEVVKAAFQMITLPFRMIWENCKGIIMTAWNTIKSTVTNALNAIKSKISSVWNAIVSVLSPILNKIKSTVTTVWNSIKSTISTVVNAIKSVVSTVFNAIKTTASTVWNAIKSTITSVLNAIKSVVSSVWNNIKSTISSVLNAIKSVVSSIWNGIKSTVSSVMNGIKSTVSSAWNSVKSTVSGVINSVKSTISSGMNAAKSTVSGVLDGIKTKFSSIFESCKSVVTGAISKIKGAFNFSWSLPKLKLPHPKITGKFSLNPPEVPKFSIEWYKKAMNAPMIMTKPTVFGYDATTGKARAGGEAGSEMVGGTTTVMSMIKAAASEGNESIIYYLKKLIEILADYFPQVLELMDQDIVLDDGVLVGRIAPKMDKELGKISERKDRGR